MSIRVGIADDQELVRAGFVAILGAHGGFELAGEAADGEQAVAIARATRPDVLLMDIRMPRLDGLAAIPLVLAASPATRVLVLTSFDLDEHVYAALRAGASGFLLKDITRAQLTDAVEVVARGDALLAPAVTRRMIASFVAGRPPARADAGPGPLTPREHQTLGLLARGLTNAEIAADMIVSEHTVKTHVGNVLMKLNLRDRIHAVIHAYENGLVPPQRGA